MSCLMIDVKSFHLDEDDVRRIQHPLVGGIILFSRNYSSKDQLIQLVTEIRAIKKNILIGVDHEGGRVQRFHEDFTAIPSMASLGRLYDNDSRKAKKLVALIGWLISKELGGCNIDFSFTPVLDVNHGNSSVIGDRSFHSEILPVEELGKCLIKGLDSGGMQAIGKHFPGHGFISEDTHHEKGEDKRLFSEIEKSDLSVFGTLVKSGIQGIMPSHIVYSLCDLKPSGLSKFWLQNQLRDSMNFKGAIFSDDMSMKAAVYSEKNITLRVTEALLAGCDMVLVCNSPQEVDEILKNLNWENDKTTIMRVSKMKLNKKKNNVDNFLGFNLSQIQSMVKKMTEQ